MANEAQKDPRKEVRFPVSFEDWFRMGLYQIGPVRADTEYTGDPNRPGPQKFDPVTKTKVWKIKVTDAAEEKATRTSYDVLLLADEEPEPTTAEIAPFVRPIALTGVTVQPRVAGQGEFKYLAYTVRATGYAPAPSARSGGPGPKSA
ncbi:hypothetical protein [Nocardia sp. CA-120079]|uniref:hypothetical protein n=1 Tax=Nocardia sp. CA-120079 TaxID=3239974 RepID=UPI003D982585